VIVGGRLVGGAARREEEVAVEAVKVSVDEELARLCGKGEGGRDRALRLGKLAGSPCFGQRRKEKGRSHLVSRLGGKRDACHDLGERFAGRDAGRRVAATARPEGVALRGNAQRSAIRHATGAERASNLRLPGQRVHAKNARGLLAVPVGQDGGMRQGSGGAPKRELAGAPAADTITTTNRGGRTWGAEAGRDTATPGAPKDVTTEARAATAFGG
jgi:hypothetical protein